MVKNNTNNNTNNNKQHNDNTNKINNRNNKKNSKEPIKNIILAKEKKKTLLSTYTKKVRLKGLESDTSTKQIS